MLGELRPRVRPKERNEAPMASGPSVPRARPGGGAAPATTPILAAAYRTPPDRIHADQAAQPTPAALPPAADRVTLSPRSTTPA
ncbi:hypothetical protein GCM10009799_11960 [Nocardiopsis rhodophaea]|uniref:Uncharacterized protein n=1 Tax=Nocardiopsis rhodophaea TaxID=280238 RepID=A0ABN2SJW9_9ACTN